MENHHAIFMGKLIISMAIFNSYVKLPKGTSRIKELPEIVGCTQNGQVVSSSRDETAEAERLVQRYGRQMGFV